MSAIFGRYQSSYLRMREYQILRVSESKVLGAYLNLQQTKKIHNQQLHNLDYLLRTPIIIAMKKTRTLIRAQHIDTDDKMNWVNCELYIQRLSRSKSENFSLQ
jgi:hypothetical protein